jgi:hypothetical protein
MFDMVKVVTTSGLVNAKIIQDVLESAGIKATSGPSDSPFVYYGGLGPNEAYDVLVPQEKMGEALKLLEEQGLLKQSK